MKKRVSIPIFVLLFIAYAAFSFYLMVYTSGGWEVLLNFFAGLLILVPAVIIFLIVLLFKYKKMKVKSFIIHKKPLLILILTQLFATLFNYGECRGDSSRNCFYSFFEVVFHMINIPVGRECNDLIHQPLLGDFAYDISILTKICYALGLFIFIRSIFTQGEENIQ